MAADFKFVDMQGKAQNLVDFRGKWVLINYWATWCPPCQHEIPELKAMHGIDLVVIGVAVDYRSAKDVARFVQNYDIHYPVVLGTQDVTSQIGELDVLPTSYLYNPSGVQVSTQKGEVSQEMVKRYIKRH